MTPLWRAVFLNRSIYEAVLPYNLNWAGRDWRSFSDFLSRNPLHVIDIGARGGSLEELDSLRNFVDYVGFDADAKETERLSGQGPRGYHGFKMFPYFVSDREGEQTFHLYKNPGDSSQLLPNPDYVAFSPNFGVERSVTVPGVTLDAMFRNESLRDVDVLKLDTQGTEFNILSSADAAISKALMIEVEVETVEMYQGQKLFHDISGLVYPKGFELLYLNRVFAGRSAYAAPTRGQIVFADALFGLKESLARVLPLEKKLKYIALLIQYGIMDYAHHLYSNDVEAQRAVPDLDRIFQKHVYGGLWSNVRRALIMQVDKAIAVLLHLRGTSHLRFDSDRSWPVR